MAGLHCSLLPIHQSRLPERDCPGYRNAGPILSSSVSNLAQNNEHWRVIVILAEMRDRPKEEHPQEYFGHLPQSGNHPYMGRKNEGESLMERALRRFRDRFRRRLASITAIVSKLFASITPAAPGFASQRMCPFCGLITSRSKTSCLECGKSLAPAR